MKWTWRLVWVTGLLLLWLLCSGTAQAGELADRLAQFPNWQSPPLVQPARGDLVYPDWFAGEWAVTTTLVEMVAPLAPEVVTPGFESNRQFLNQPIRFKVRFVEASPHGLSAVVPLLLGESRQIVSDRAYNGLNLAKAYLGDRSVLAVKVDPDNPNRQLTLLKSEVPNEPLRVRQLISTVTARATEAVSDDQFITSEVFRQEFRNAAQIYFNDVENTTAYRRQPSEQDPSQPAITADQVTAIYLSPQDPDYFKTIAPDSFLGDPRPVALYRYRMEFVADEAESRSLL